MSTSRVNSVVGKNRRRESALSRFSVKTMKQFTEGIEDAEVNDEGKKSYDKYVERKNVELKALKDRVRS